MKIDRYSGFVFEGEGTVTDHLNCTDLISFSFHPSDQELAAKCCKLIVDFLNGEGNEKV